MNTKATQSTFDVSSLVEQRCVAVPRPESEGARPVAHAAQGRQPGWPLVVAVVVACWFVLLSDATDELQAERDREPALKKDYRQQARPGGEPGRVAQAEAAGRRNT